MRIKHYGSGIGLFVFIVASAIGGVAVAAAELCAVPVVFFDLGEVVVHSDYIEEADVFVNTKYLPGGYEYLRGLKELGYHLGLLVNYPESYGGGLPTISERDRRKIGIVKREVTEPLPEKTTSQPAFKNFCREKFGDDAGRLCQTWTDTEHSMDWSVFGFPEFPEIPGLESEGIFVPDRDFQRKPDPYLFERGLRAAAALFELSGRDEKPCPVVYMGEDPVEVAAAEKAGMIGILVGNGSWVIGKEKPSFFYPVQFLKRLAGTPAVIPPNGPKLEAKWI